MVLTRAPSGSLVAPPEAESPAPLVPVAETRLPGIMRLHQREVVEREFLAILRGRHRSGLLEVEWLVVLTPHRPPREIEVSASTISGARPAFVAGLMTRQRRDADRWRRPRPRGPRPHALGRRRAGRYPQRAGLWGPTVGATLCTCESACRRRCATLVDLT